MSRTLFVTVGLPMSGKSTWAESWMVPTVSPDAIRLALHGEAFIKRAEPTVWAMAETFVLALFEAGHDKVILDATSVDERSRQRWVSQEWATKFVLFDTPAYACMNRASDEGRVDLYRVIERMNERLEFPTENIVQPVEGGYIPLDEANPRRSS